MILAATVFALASCAGPVTGTATNETPYETAAPQGITAIPVYTPDPDGGGWPSQPIDQPRPFPGSDWDWHRDDEDDLGVCRFLGATLMRKLGWNGEKPTVTPACVIPTGPDTVVQISVGRIYQNFNAWGYDDLAFMRPVTISGLEAREFDLAADQEKYAGTCQVSVNTRSVTSFTVMVGTSSSGGATTVPAPQCARARTDATLIVQTFVPLAGGTPWPRTPQTIDPTVQRRAELCDVLGPSQLAIGGIETATGTPSNTTPGAGGASCTYSQDGIRIIIRTTPGHDLPGSVQQAQPGAGPTHAAALGPAAARMKLSADGHTCLDAAQATSDSIMSVQYTNPGFPPAEVCKASEGILGGAAETLIDNSP